jgi:hypothetical protein
MRSTGYNANLRAAIADQRPPTASASERLEGEVARALAAAAGGALKLEVWQFTL